MKISTNTAAMGPLVGKLINKAKALLQDITSNNYHWASERGQPKQGGGHEIGAFAMLVSKVDALSQKLNHL